jgi:3-hydroxyacyl-[acyl-carrier-protein] dehydratase
MLLNDFYNLSSIESTDTLVKCTITLNDSHAIFKGHFPDIPVVPGVCMMQMVKEILETTLNQKMKIIKADHLKFLSVITPQQITIFEAELKYNINENGEISVEAKFFSDTMVFFKMRAKLNSSAVF